MPTAKWFEDLQGVWELLDADDHPVGRAER